MEVHTWQWTDFWWWLNRKTPETLKHWLTLSPWKITWEGRVVHDSYASLTSQGFHLAVFPDHPHLHIYSIWKKLTSADVAISEPTFFFIHVIIILWFSEFFLKYYNIWLQKAKKIKLKKLCGKEKAGIKFHQKTYISNIIFMVKNVFKQHLKCKKCCIVLSIFYKEVE